MTGWDAERIAAAAGARLVGHELDPAADGPSRVIIDSRAAGPGDLFVGLRGEATDGGAYAIDALAAGAWGVLTDPVHAAEAAAAGMDGAVLCAERPVAALGGLARAWRRELGCPVIAVTGSTGKTSTKDILAALLAPHRTVHASRANYNTEIGLPLELLCAPPGTEVLVLELAMRGAGQIAELTAICEPDVGIITNVGPVHLQQLGTVENVARAKGELLREMRDGATAVLPAGEALLTKQARAHPKLELVTFGDDGDVRALSRQDGRLVVGAGGQRLELELPFTQDFNVRNTLAAVAAARAIGVTPGGQIDVTLSALRGERIDLPGGATLVNDCYNANPLSMHAAIDDLCAIDGSARRIAVLGDMLELGPQERELHAEVGAHAARCGVSVLIAVGALSEAMLAPFAGEAHAVSDAGAAAELLRATLGDGDVVLIKGSRGMALEGVAAALTGPGG